MIELTKSQKKTARKLINLGLQRECAKFMQSTKDFMNKNASAEDAHDAYLKLYALLSRLEIIGPEKAWI